MLKNQKVAPLELKQKGSATTLVLPFGNYGRHSSKHERLADAGPDGGGGPVKVFDTSPHSKKGFAEFGINMVKTNIAQTASEFTFEQKSTSVFLNRSKYAIDPKWPSAKRWDGLMVALLVYTALFTPFEVAFLETDLNILFFWNRFVDAAFTFDLFMNFFAITSNKETGEPVADLRSIGFLYLTGWFPVDLVSVLPFDSVSFVLQTVDPTASESLSTLKILRIIRLARLIKLLRVVRASRLLNRYESGLGLSFSWISITKCSFGMLVIAHWLACAFHLVPMFVDASPHESWIFASDIQDKKPLSRYLFSLYWSITTVTTVGYGDITPRNDFEMMWCTVFMVIGGIFYAYVMGSICGIVSSLDEAGTCYKRTMDVLNLYMEDVKLPYEARMGLRDYFMHCKGLQRSKFFKEVLTQMSPGLQGKFAIHCYGTWINRVYFLRALSGNREERFIQRIALALEMEAYPPYEPIITLGEPTLRMYIIKRGVCARLGHVLTKGTCFGEDVILSLCTPRLYSVMALTYVDVHMLRKIHLQAILDSGEFPIRKRIVRKATVKLAVTRGIVAIANAYRKHQNSTGNGWTISKEEVLRKIRLNREKLRKLANESIRGDTIGRKVVEAFKKQSSAQESVGSRLLAKLNQIQVQHMDAQAALSTRMSRIEEMLSS